MFKRLTYGIGGITLLGLVMFANTPVFAGTGRVIDDNNRVVMKGNVHPKARPENDIGTTDSSLPMERMVFTLKRSPAKQANLEKLLADQLDSASPNYHHWLTPEEFGNQFGLNDDEIGAITAWLTSQGFSIDEVGKGRNWINFSGQVHHVESAFRTKMHDYKVDGQIHHANAQEPSIPRALASQVAGVVSLHNFPLKALNTGAKLLATENVQPAYTDPTDGSHHLMVPGDFATIYNVNPLYNAGINGSGVSIAIVGHTNPPINDWSIFRDMMGLPNNPPQVITNVDPGDVSYNEDIEADLDVEWAGAVAKNATIIFVTSKSVATDGALLSIQFIVNNNVAPIMSTSFSACESMLSSAANAFFNNFWSQAAAQGITSFVASGDYGAGDCTTTDSNGNILSWALGVNGIASTPYNVAVGGTMFNEGSGNFWNIFNETGFSSALSYIPEVVWNENGMGGATGGGASSLYAKPIWQVGPGVPADGMRDIPDVSLAASLHDAYYVVVQGQPVPGGGVGGTSASSPAFAGLMALIVQKTGERQGNINPKLYQLGYSQYNLNGPKVFHDITSGNNSFQGVTGYTAGVGYDLATGLGSVDATVLVNNWPVQGGSYPAIANGGWNYNIPLYLPPGATSPTATSTYCASWGEYDCDFTRPTPLFGYISATSFAGSVPLYLPSGVAYPEGLTTSSTYCFSMGEYECDGYRTAPLFGYISATSFAASVPLYLPPSATSPTATNTYCANWGEYDCDFTRPTPLFGYMASPYCPFGGTFSGVTCNR